MTSLQLVWKDAQDVAPQTYQGELPITIGREEDNSIVLHSSLISRHHARLESRESQVLILDQNSTNGVFVNGRRVSEVVLRKGDSFRVGMTSFTLPKEPLTSRLRSRLGIFWPSEKKSPAHAVVMQQGNQLLFGQANKPPVVLQAGDSVKMGGSQLGILPNVTAEAESDVGIKRAARANQDTVGLYSDLPLSASQLLKKGMLFLVADGMGGAAGGEEASKLAVETTLKEYYADSDAEIERSLEHSIQAANIKVYQRGHSSPELWGMGTTIVAAVIDGYHLVVANVGDSRAYLFRQGQLKKLSTDHSLVQGLIDAGIITPQEAATHPQRNVLLRDLGDQKRIQPDLKRETLQEGDVILLCSDGLWGVLQEQEMIDVLQGQNGHQAAHTLIEMANQHGGPDNISVIVLHVQQLPAPQKAG